MYEEFYGLSRPPFTNIPDPDFLYLSPQHKRALSVLKYALISRAGFCVTACTNSLKALESFEAAPESFDLVITDQTMPHMTGADLTQALRRLRPDIPVILCTGFSHVLDAEKAQALGANAFMMKPLDFRELIHHVHLLIESQPQAHTPPLP